jgi:ABC-type amino acid transport substrate-binding protein
MDASSPPFESIASDGSLAGLDVDLAREVSRRLGLDPQFVANLPYDGLYDALIAGRVDIVVSALVVDPSRTGEYAYSDVYFDAGHVLVARADNDMAPRMKDLSGYSLAVALGTEGDSEARKWARRLANLEVVQHETAIDALGAVESGNADVALVDHVSALQAVGSGRDLAVIGEPVTDAPYACAVRRESIRLLKAVNKALRAMEADGTTDAFISRWLRSDS